jgi:RNA polymerase sigma factor (sigma-70 family)
VARHEEEHLRRFVAARDSGDGAAMRRWWEELVIDFADRMDGLVAAAHRGALDTEEHELAVAMSLTRFSVRLLETFAGTSVGELVNACKTLAQHICMDVQRASMRRRRHEGPSLDSGWDAEAADGPAPSWEADAAADRFEREQRSAEIADFLAWALPQINPQRRRVLELSFEGAALPEIAAELAISKDNVYQRRSRGMRDLTRLKEQYDA